MCSLKKKVFKFCSDSWPLGLINDNSLSLVKWPCQLCYLSQKTHPGKL